MLLIWERYFIKEVLKTFILFLCIFYGLYTLIDYASHMSGASYHHTRLKIGELFTHYACEFIVRAEILVPFALLIAVVKTLCQLNVQNEFVALLAAGFSKRRLLAPFVLIALIVTALLYFNSEYFLPKASKRLQRFNEKYIREKPKTPNKQIVNHLVLEDGSTLLFRTFSQTLGRFEESFWIRSIDEIWRIAALKPSSKAPIAEYIEVFKRNDEGVLTLASAKEQAEIPEMHFNKKRLIETITPPDELSLSELTKKLQGSNASNSEKEARLFTIYYRKIVMPWLTLLAIIGIAPFCLQYTRQLSVFILYAAAIFGLVTIYLMIDAATVLGERQVVAPFPAIFVPFTFFATLFIVRLWRMK